MKPFEQTVYAGKDFEQPDEVKRLQERLNLHYQVSFT